MLNLYPAMLRSSSTDTRRVIDDQLEFPDDTRPSISFSPLELLQISVRSFWASTLDSEKTDGLLAAHGHLQEKIAAQIP